jgi:hypothetical protein
MPDPEIVRGSLECLRPAHKSAATFFSKFNKLLISTIPVSLNQANTERKQPRFLTTVATFTNRLAPHLKK